MKKLVALIAIAFMVVGCGTSGNAGTAPKEINVYTRDGSSGTREAFESIIGLEEGKLTTDSAETSSNGDMATQVGKDKNAVGYVSLTTDFEANGLKPLKYDGVEATIASVNSGEYKLARPFSFVTRATGDFGSTEKEQLVAAFIDYLTHSTEGLQVVLSAGGIVDASKGKPWAELKVNHPIVDQDNSGLTLKTAGSTSVEKTLTVAVQSFIPLAGNFKFEPNQTGSGDGYKRVLGSEKDSANAADIGFASRSFKTEEAVSGGLLSGVYAKDAVVVVVEKDNTTVDSLTAAQLVAIFDGTVKEWENASK